MLACAAVLTVAAAWPGQAPVIAQRAALDLREAGPEITLAFGGDVHFEGGITAALSRDPTSVLGDAAAPLRAADVAVVNLETAVGTRGAPAPKQYTFCAPASALAALRDAGVDAVSLANNHALDHGPAGLADAVSAARGAGVHVVGAGRDEQSAFRPWTTSVGGQRITVLAATQVLDTSLQASWAAAGSNPGVASADDPDRLLDEVRTARRDGGLVVVYLHWGRERDPCPPEEARGLAQLLVDAGADVIVGAHAHIRSPDARLGNAYVHYGLGNLLWYRDTADSRGGVLTLTSRGRSVTSTAWLPLRMEEFRPVLADAASTVPPCTHQVSLEQQ